MIGETLVWTTASFERPLQGPLPPKGLQEQEAIPLSGRPGWASNGGPTQKHPGRALPSLLEFAAEPPEGTQLAAIRLIGVLGRFASCEPSGTVGATVLMGEGPATFRVDLLNGRHYEDPSRPNPLDRGNGDGTCLRTLGLADWEGESFRLDELEMEVPPGTSAERILFRDLGTPAMFVLFEIGLGWKPVPGCPFHSGHGGVPLSELGSVIRLRDRVRFRRAVEQLEEAIRHTPDLDEARGEALTFIAVSAAATLELGAPRSMHRLQLEAARALDRAASTREILAETRKMLDRAVGALFEQGDTPNERLIDRALEIVDRQYARPLTDAKVAEQLGLSPSHFRYLFRQAMGQPFHKYLISTRLERARVLLTEQALPVSEVAAAVGFSGLSHFSRTFTQRFGVRPTQVRNSVR
jgi:AraC-like DNA-binding protein